MNSQLTVLAIDDDPGDAELLQRSLSEVPGWTVNFIHATGADEARRQLTRTDVDFIFLDYVLGADTSDSVLGEMRSMGDLRPLVILTGQGDEAVAAKLMRSGADDYLIKGQIDSATLRRAMDNARAQQGRRESEARNRSLLEDLQVVKSSLEIKNRRLAELYDTAHEFVDHVSHEFRTPLTVIREFAAILRDGLAGELNDEQCEFAGIIVNQVDDLSALIDDMLDISKIEAGMLGISRHDCTVKDIVARIQTTLERRAAASKIALHIDIPHGLPELYCDPQNIGRIIINLVVNAVKFCREGGHVVLRVQALESSDEVVFSIIDDGPGIPPESLRAIFERFQQVSHSARTGIKGFGLGLSIVRELVRLNLGDLTVASEVGTGSTFSFTVPTSARLPLMERYLDRVARFLNPSTAVSLIELSTPATKEEYLIGLEHLIEHRMRRCDLLFRVAPSRWILVAAANQRECAPLLKFVDKAIADANQNRLSGALPQAHARCLGTWDIDDARDALVEEFVAQCEERKSVYA